MACQETFLVTYSKGLTPALASDLDSRQTQSPLTLSETLFFKLLKPFLTYAFEIYYHSPLPCNATPLPKLSHILNLETNLPWLNTPLLSSLEMSEGLY